MTSAAQSKADFGKGRTVIDRAEKKGNTAALGRLQRVLEDQGVDLSDLGNVKALWAKTSVDPETGDEVYSGSSVLLTPSWETGPAWAPVDRPPLPKVVVPKVAKGKGIIGRWKTAMALPDPQIGYRRLPNGSLDPFHDPRALDVAFQLLEAERPDLAIWLGDFLDLAPMSRFRQDPAFALTVQPAIDRATEVIAATTELAGETRLIEGNHDQRLQTYVIDNAMAAYGLRRGGDAPESWPVLSVPYLLRLEDLDVQWVDGYPNGATYINDSIAAIHGRTLDLSKVVKDEQVSVIQGHTHHLGVATQTRNTRGAPRFNVALSPGCLCRIDGAVPGTTSSTTTRGLPAKSWQNWQQGVAVVRYTDDGLYTWDLVPIQEGWALHDKQEFEAAAGLHDR